MLAQAPNPRPSPPLPVLPLSDVSLGPVVMADDPCEAAFGSATPTGPRKYYRARYYDPGVQRFTSEDPLGFSGGDANLHSYVGNSPVNFVDPTGELAPWAAACLAGAAWDAAWYVAEHGRKSSWGGAAAAAARGCGAGLLGFGAGKAAAAAARAAAAASRGARAGSAARNSAFLARKSTNAATKCAVPAHSERRD